MKKWLTILRVSLVLFSARSVMAEEPAIMDDPTIAQAAAFEAKEDAAADRAASRSDVVEIDGNQYAVVTGENIGIAYEAPEGVYVLTQDYVRQADLFDRFYNDPLSAASSFVENGMHMNIYDSENKVDIFIYISTADWASLYPDAADLDDDEVELLDAYFRRNGLDVAQDYTFGKAGNNCYFFYNCLDADQDVWMMTSVGGYQIRVVYDVKTMDQVVRGLELLEGLTIAAV